MRTFDYIEHGLFFDSTDSWGHLLKTTRFVHHRVRGLELIDDRSPHDPSHLCFRMIHVKDLWRISSLENVDVPYDIGKLFEERKKDILTEYRDYLLDTLKTVEKELEETK